MKVKEIKENEIFSIEDIQSYPKLKTATGYIDIRDNIVNDSGNCNEKDAQTMPLELLARQYDGTIDEIKNWVKEQTGVKI